MQNLNWRGQIETAKVKLSHVLCRPITREIYTSPNLSGTFSRRRLFYRNAAQTDVTKTQNGERGTGNGKLKFGKILKKIK